MTLLSFGLLIVSILVSFLISKYENNAGVRLRSDLLVSDAAHTSSDIFVSLSVIVSLAAVSLGYPVVDPIASVIIALFIAKSAFDIFKRGIDVLSDRAVLDPRNVQLLVCGPDSAIKCHQVRTRGRRDHVFIDLHLSLPGEMSIAREHQIEHEIQKKLKKSIPGVEEVYFHVEPEK